MPHIAPRQIGEPVRAVKISTSQPLSSSNYSTRQSPAFSRSSNNLGRLRHDTPLASLRPGHNNFNRPAAASAVHKPRVPGRNARLSAVALGHLGRVGCRLAVAIEASHDQPHSRRSGVAQRHRRPAIALNCRHIRRPSRLILDRKGSSTLWRSLMSFCPSCVASFQSSRFCLIRAAIADGLLLNSPAPIVGHPAEIQA
jgi:hypothetical protein